MSTQHVHVWMFGVLVFTGTDIQMEKRCVCGGLRLFPWEPLP